MYITPTKRAISRIIVIGLILQIAPIHKTQCNAASIAVALPQVMYYLSGLATAFMALQQHSLSKSMTSMIKEVHTIAADAHTVINTPPNATSVTSPTTLIGHENINQKLETTIPDKPIAHTVTNGAISQDVIEKFRTSIRHIVATPSQQFQQRRYDYFANMRKPSSFEMHTIPGGIRVVHSESGLSFSARIQPLQNSPERTISQAEWDALLKAIPKEQGQVLNMCRFFGEGNIQAAHSVMQSSDSSAVHTIFTQHIEDLFNHWSQDPLARNITPQQRCQLLANGKALADFFDCLAIREMLCHSLNKTFKVTSISPRVVKDAVYALCDVTAEGKLCCMPREMNQRLYEYISGVDTESQQELISIFYLPNGMLRDFAKETVTRALDMPASIQTTEHNYTRKLLNDLVLAHITATTQAEQLLTTKAIINIKYALTYPMPENIREVFLTSAELAVESLQQGYPNFVERYMVDADHFKELKPLQIVVQSEIGDHKNGLIEYWLKSVEQKQFNNARIKEYQLITTQYAVHLVRKDLPEHALQLNYKIMMADPKTFSNGVPKFTTIVKEDANHWVERDMQGNIIKKCHKTIKDPASRKAKRHIKKALKEFHALSKEDPLPETSNNTHALHADGMQHGCTKLPDSLKPIEKPGCSSPPKSEGFEKPGCGIPQISPSDLKPGCGSLPKPSEIGKPGCSGKLPEDTIQLYHTQQNETAKTPNDKEKIERLHGDYEDAPYHTTQGNKVKSKRPKNGQKALDNSIEVPNKDDSKKKVRRIGVAEDEIVILDQTSPGKYHGHVREWNELTPQMQKALRDAELTNPRGKII